MSRMKRVKILFMAACMVALIGTTAFGADYSNPDPGTKGILPGDTMTLPDNTAWATLTASWGVRVKFLDYDETELQNEVLPVSEKVKGETTAPDDPSRDGYTFVGWERYDSNKGPATLNDDGTVTEIDGPGPIVYIAVYEKIPGEDPDEPTPDDPDDPIPSDSDDPQPDDPTPDDSQPSDDVTEDQVSEEPNTGDSTDVGLWITLFALSGAAIGGTAVYRRRNADK